MPSANFRQTPALELAVDRHGRFADITHLDRRRDKVRMLSLFYALSRGVYCTKCSIHFMLMRT